LLRPAPYSLLFWRVGCWGNYLDRCNREIFAHKGTHMMRLVTKYSNRIYTPESILLTTQDFKEYATVLLADSDNDLTVEATIDESKITEAEFLSLFNKALDDNQLRVSIYEKTSAIRQMIVAQAFAPCDNLSEIVEAFESNEE